MLQFFLASKNLQEQYLDTLYLPLEPYIYSTASSALSKASVSSFASFLELKIYRNSAVVKAFFRSLNTFSCFAFYRNLSIFFIISKISKVIFKQSLINFQQKFVNLIKNYTFFTILEVFQSQISANFFRSALILFYKIINFKYLVYIVQNLLFFYATYSLQF